MNKKLINELGYVFEFLAFRFWPSFWTLKLRKFYKIELKTHVFFIDRGGPHRVCH